MVLNKFKASMSSIEPLSIKNNNSYVIWVVKGKVHSVVLTNLFSVGYRLDYDKYGLFSNI